MTLTFEQAVERRELDGRTLGQAFLKQTRAAPGHMAIIDAEGELTRAKLAGAALALRSLLRKKVFAQRVGVLLPPGRGGAIVNLALALDGRTSVNLNHTAGVEQMRRMCQLAEVTTIITAQRYLDKIGPLDLPGQVLLVDTQLMPLISKMEVAKQMARLFWPASIDRSHAGDVATLLFSSGTTGDPKGIELTHAQILANIESVRSALKLDQSDVVLSALPLFHSFGLLPGMWLGLVTGMTVAHCPNPQDSTMLGEVALKSKATTMLSTPTFCRAYLRRVKPEHFKHLEFAVVGAEKCPDNLKDAFLRRFDCRLMEGYGCTELAPVVSANLPARGGAPASERSGSVGRPLPGIEVWLVDPESGEVIKEPNQSGLIIVRSAARMRGYLNRPDLTEKAFLHEGYNTGDMGYIDEHGYLFITGRLARFAKIGGEMVPLDRVEEEFQTLLAKHGQGFEIAISSVEDEARGERLVALYTELPSKPEELRDQLSDLPALFKPRPRDFYQVDEIPVLGTGKRDLKRVKDLARSVAAERATASD